MQKKIIYGQADRAVPSCPLQIPQVSVICTSGLTQRLEFDWIFKNVWVGRNPEGNLITSLVDNHDHHARILTKLFAA